MIGIACVIGGIALLCILGQWARPLRPIDAGLRARKLGRARRLARNIALALLNFAAAPVIVVWVTSLAVDWAPSIRPAWLWGWTGFAVDVLLLDLWIYAWHRVVHAWSFAWRFHETHHQDEAVDVTTALRFHAADVMMSSTSRAVVVFLAAIPMAHIFWFEVLTVAFSIFHHANVRLPEPVEKALSTIIVTPRMHGAHHRRERREHDASYGTILSLWDRCLHTIAFDTRENDGRVGLAHQPEEGLFLLLIRPFRSRTSPTEVERGEPDGAKGLPPMRERDRVPAKGS